MANPEHVALVLQGAEAIRKWRQEHPDERLDLSGADLSGANLLHADLSGADLSGADLSGAFLLGANLFEANLNGANLSHADLSGANLFEANLSGANLSHADLSGANLSHADLSGANLSGAELWRADLGWTNLSTADITGAHLFRGNLMAANLSQGNLSEADLSAANLMWADLSEANLSGANLSGANLSGANLSRAELTLAKLRYTSLADVDLNQVTGLATVNHEAPSSVGVDTLIASFRGAGNKLTPELTAFFLDAGVPQELLDALPDIVREVKHYSCFISYGQPDLQLATRLYEDLKSRGVSCWLWEMDKTVGKPTWGEIEQKLEEYERMVVLCSIDALIRRGFKKEVDKQIDKNPDNLVPVSLDNRWTQDGFEAEWAGRDLKTWLLDRNYADFANKPYEEALEDLLKGLRRPAVKKGRRKKG